MTGAIDVLIIYMYSYVSLSRQEKRKHSRQSSSSVILQVKEKNDIHAECDPMLDLISTGQDSGTEQQNQNGSIPDLSTSSIDEPNAITSWMSQFQADSMKILPSPAFPTSLGQYDSRNTRAHDKSLTGMELHHESDNNSLVPNSTNSSNSLYPFLDSALNSDMYDTTWSSTNLSPALSESLSLMQDHHERGKDSDGWLALTTECPEAAKACPTTEVPSTTKLTKTGKTVLTLENLDSETRGEIVDLLCKRKIVTTIEIV